MKHVMKIYGEVGHCYKRSRYGLHMKLSGQMHDLAVSEKGNLLGFTSNWRQSSLQNWLALGVFF